MKKKNKMNVSKLIVFYHQYNKNIYGFLTKTISLHLFFLQPTMFSRASWGLSSTHRHWITSTWMSGIWTTRTTRQWQKWDFICLKAKTRSKLLFFILYSLKINGSIIFKGVHTLVQHWDTMDKISHSEYSLNPHFELIKVFYSMYLYIFMDFRDFAKYGFLELFDHPLLIFYSFKEICWPTFWKRRRLTI